MASKTAKEVGITPTSTTTMDPMVIMEIRIITTAMIMITMAVLTVDQDATEDLGIMASADTTMGLLGLLVAAEVAGAHPDPLAEAVVEVVVVSLLRPPLRLRPLYHHHHHPLRLHRPSLPVTLAPIAVAKIKLQL